MYTNRGHGLNWTQWVKDERFFSMLERMTEYHISWLIGGRLFFFSSVPLIKPTHGVPPRVSSTLKNLSLRMKTLTTKTIYYLPQYNSLTWFGFGNFLIKKKELNPINIGQWSQVWFGWFELNRFSLGHIWVMCVDWARLDNN